MIIILFPIVKVDSYHCKFDQSRLVDADFFVARFGADFSLGLFSETAPIMISNQRSWFPLVSSLQLSPLTILLAAVGVVVVSSSIVTGVHQNFKKFSKSHSLLI